MKINEVTKKGLTPVVEATADEVRTGLQQRLSSRDYDRTMSWVADEYNDFATQEDVDRFVADAAAQRDNFWQMPYARAAREAIFGLNTGAGRRDNTPTGEEPIVPLDTVTPTGEIPPGNVIPRPRGVAGGDWDRRYGATHNPDGSPKTQDEPPAETPPTQPTPPERPGPRPTPTPGGTPARQDPAAGDGPEPSQTPDDFRLTGNLRRGSRGDEVRALQAALGLPANEQDGIFGPRTEQAVRTFQQNQGLQVDGIVGAQTYAAIQRSRENPNAPRNVAPGQIQNQSKENTGNALLEGITKLAGLEKMKLNEASINISGADASEVSEILRMMQLAGAPGAKIVGADDINPGPKPCPICGKIHGPAPTPGGCGMPEPEGPPEPSMGDMIRMVSKEEEELDGDFQNATTEPDEEYTNDVSASIPSGNDLHKEKGSYPATAGGDNPMNTQESIKAKLLQALSEKKAKPDYIDIDGDGDKKEPMKKAVKDKKSKKK